MAMITPNSANFVMQDPAVPMVQLPMKFRSRRTNTATAPRTNPDPYHVDILDVEGAGCIRHIWFLFAEGRRLEVTVDGAVTPQIDVPLKPFFGIMHDWTPYLIDNAAFTVMPNYETPNMPGNPGYNLWLPIPFSKSCKIRIYVDRPPTSKHSGLHQSVCTMVDWHEYEPDTEITPFRLHAEHHKYLPAPPRNSSFAIADVDGSGFLGGVILGARQRNYNDMVYHTGGMVILIDGETDPNLIRGTNMEDDFGFSWGFHLHQTRWHGSPYHKWGGPQDQDGVAYRFFGPDPIAFESSLSFQCGSRDDDIETVAYYYKVAGSQAKPIVSPSVWLVTGLYDEALNWDKFNAEEEIDRLPLRDWKHRFSDKPGFIREIQANRGWLDLRFSGLDPELDPSELIGKSIYAGGAILSSENRKAVIRISYDDWLAVWLNGEKIGTLKADGSLTTVRIPIQLNQGENELRIKSNNLGHPWNPWVINTAIEY